MITIWHNPRCSKSRDTLALIEASGHPFVIRRYLEDTPTEHELKAAQSALGVPVIDMVRRGEKAFRELALNDVDDATLLLALTQHPILIERPIVLHMSRAVIGRPPENVLKLL